MDLKDFTQLADQMQDELMTGINKLKAITAIYEKAHKDVATVLNSNNLKLLPHDEVAAIAKGEKFKFDPAGPNNPMPVKEKKVKDPNAPKRPYNRTAPSSGTSIAEKTREFMDKFYKGQQEFSMGELVKRVAGLIPEANYNNVSNAFARYLKEKNWSPTYHRVTTGEGASERKMILNPNS